MQSKNDRPVLTSQDVLVFLTGMVIGILIGVLALDSVSAGIGSGAGIGLAMVIALRSFR